MSRLCRLRSSSHGEDGKWAHEEILRLRAALQHKKESEMNIAEKLRAAYQDDTDPLCWVAASEIDLLREQIATQKAYYDSVFEDGARRIAKLTEQRDMAVEALEESHALIVNVFSDAEPEMLSYYSEYRPVMALCAKALAAIKSSEVKE